LEHLVGIGLAFFDDRVDAAVKDEMVKNLQHLPKPKALKDLKVEVQPSEPSGHLRDSVLQNCLMYLSRMGKSEQHHSW